MRKKKKNTIYEETEKILTEEDLNSEDSQKNCECENESGCECGEKCSCDATKNEYLEMAQRLQAEFDNYRKRNADMARIARQDGISYAVMELLPIVDSVNSAKRQITDESFLNSINLVYNQIISCFEKIGVKRIEALNQPFNPELHNAIMAEEKEGIEPDMVIEEYQEGFCLNNKVIRHSVVKVSK